MIWWLISVHVNNNVSRNIVHNIMKRVILNYHTSLLPPYISILCILCIIPPPRTPMFCLITIHTTPTLPDNINYIFLIYTCILVPVSLRNGQSVRMIYNLEISTCICNNLLRHRCQSPRRTLYSVHYKFQMWSTPTYISVYI